LIPQRSPVKINTPIFEVQSPTDIRRLLVLLTLGALVAGCQPQDVRPGLWLGGENVSSPVEDWRFTDQIEEVFIETRPWYGIPHSTTIWCVQVGNELFIGSYGEKKKFWEINILRDYRAKIGIMGKIYDVAVTRLDDAAVHRSVTMAYQRKYDMAEVFGKKIPAWSFYRVEQEGNEKPST